jgi:hypothetical protein
MLTMTDVLRTASLDTGHVCLQLATTTAFLMAAVATSMAATRYLSASCIRLNLVVIISRLHGGIQPLSATQRHGLQ